MERHEVAAETPFEVDFHRAPKLIQQMNEENLYRCFSFCREVERTLTELLPGIQCRVAPKFEGNSFSYADVIQGIPEVLLVSMQIGPGLDGGLSRQMCVDIPGAELAQASDISGRALVLKKYCDRLSAWQSSPSALKPSSHSIYSAKFLSRVVSSDSPICLHNEKTGETIDYSSTDQALAAYFLIGHTPNTNINDLNILKWENARWIILAPESLMRRSG